MNSTSILDLIGHTPLLAMPRITSGLRPGVSVLAKAEFLNPGGSVKDRPALNMVVQAEQQGRLTHDRVIMDASSGNTAIAYALIGAVKGYRVEVVLPENASQERKKMIREYGASILYSDPMQGSDGAILMAKHLLEQYPDKYFLPDQYNNDANWQAHAKTTAPEIWEQTDGGITHFVAGIGTSGTMMGTGRGLKEFRRDIQVIEVEPSDALHGLEGMKHMASSIMPGIYRMGFADRKISVETEDAYAMRQRLSREEGLLVGHSSGANMWAAMQIASEIEAGVIVTVFCDGGGRYLSEMQDGFPC